MIVKSLNDDIQAPLNAVESKTWKGGWRNLANILKDPGKLPKQPIEPNDNVYTANQQYQIE